MKDRRARRIPARQRDTLEEAQALITGHSKERTMNALMSTKIPGAKEAFSGKVRDVYNVDREHLLIVSTDRISAFDHVFFPTDTREGNNIE
jgi:hypothetical protein